MIPEAEPKKYNKNHHLYLVLNSGFSGIKKNLIELFALPSSCGNSSIMTASEMLTPFKTVSVNAAPIERPSIKLCKPSPKIIIHATGATELKLSKW